MSRAFIHLRRTLRAGGRVIVALSLAWLPASARSADRSDAASAPAAHRVACAGDSLTRLPQGNAYPEQLARLLGDGWEVRNFGHNGVTAIRETGRPFWKVSEFDAVSEFQPDVIILMFGTNDASLAAGQRKAFAEDYLALIRHYRALPSRPRIVLMTPPPLIPGRDDERMINLKDELCPVVRKLAADEHLALVDLQEDPTLRDPALYPDKVHVNEAGAGIVAAQVRQALLMPEKPGVAMAQVKEGTPLPSGRGNHAGGMVNGVAVVAGGTQWNEQRTQKRFLDDSLRFVDGGWQPGPPMPHAVAEPMFAADGNQLFVAGGRRSGEQINDGVYRLAETDRALRWSKLASLPKPRTAGAGALVDGRFFVACGQVDGSPTNHLLALDTTAADGAWATCRDLPGEPRLFPAMVAVKPFLYLFGGMQPPRGSDQPKMRVLDDAWRYDTRSDQWEKLKDLPAGGYAWAAAAVDGDRVLLAGRADGAIHPDLWLVNPTNMHTLCIGEAVIQSTCAPLLRVDERTFWLVGGEPDSRKTRTPRVSVISLDQGGGEN